MYACVCMCGCACTQQFEHHSKRDRPSRYDPTYGMIWRWTMVDHSIRKAGDEDHKTITRLN